MASLFFDMFLFSKKVIRYTWVRIKRSKNYVLKLGRQLRKIFINYSKNNPTSKRPARCRFVIIILGCSAKKCSDAEKLARQLNLVVNDFEISIYTDCRTPEAPHALDHIQYFELTQLQRKILKWSFDDETLIIGGEPRKCRAYKKQDLRFMQVLSLKILSLGSPSEYTLIVPEHATIGSNLFEQITRNWYERKYHLLPE